MICSKKYCTSGSVRHFRTRSRCASVYRVNPGTEPNLVRAQLQNEVVVAIILKVLVHLADVGMVQRLVNPNFAHELALRPASRRNLLEILGLGQARLLHHLARILLPRSNAR